MVVTVVEGTVPGNRAAELLGAWGDATEEALPPGLVESFLLRANDAWRIVTVWESRAALEEMRRSSDEPAAFKIFRSVGVEPTLSVFDAVEHLTA